MTLKDKIKAVLRGTMKPAEIHSAILKKFGTGSNRNSIRSNLSTHSDFKQVKGVGWSLNKVSKMDSRSLSINKMIKTVLKNGSYLKAAEIHSEIEKHFKLEVNQKSLAGILTNSPDFEKAGNSKWKLASSVSKGNSRSIGINEMIKTVLKNGSYLKAAEIHSEIEKHFKLEVNQKSVAGILTNSPDFEKAGNSKWKLASSVSKGNSRSFGINEMIKTVLKNGLHLKTSEIHSEIEKHFKLEVNRKSIAGQLSNSTDFEKAGNNKWKLASSVSKKDSRSLSINEMIKTVFMNGLYLKTSEIHSEIEKLFKLEVSQKSIAGQLTNSPDFEKAGNNKWKLISLISEEEEKIPDPKSHRHYLFNLQDGFCNGCDEKITEKNCHVDHIIPISRRGTDHIDNLQVLCPNCNLSKQGKTMEEHRSNWRNIAKNRFIDKHPDYVRVEEMRKMFK